MRRKSKLTPQIENRLDEVAALKRLTPSYKELERETGLSRTHLSNLIRDRMRASVNICAVPHGTNEQDQFTTDLLRK